MKQEELTDAFRGELGIHVLSPAERAIAEDIIHTGEDLPTFRVLKRLRLLAGDLENIAARIDKAS